MGWINVGGSDSNTATSGSSSTNQNMDYTGKQTPVIDPKFQTAYTNVQGNVNATGATPEQQAAIDFAKKQLTNNPVNAAVTAGNAGLIQNKASVDGVTAGYDKLAAQDPHLLSANAPTVTAEQGAKYADTYQNPYTNDVVKTTLANYDQNTGNQLNSLRASRDAGSAFGDRANLGDGAFLNQSDLNRASTEAGLRDTAFNTAQGYGQQDATRALTADTTNSNLLNDREEFNVNSQYKSDADKQAALQGAQESLKQSAGLTQQTIDNVVTQNGIDTAAAQALFTSGQITQQQLTAIMNAAASFNGTSATGSQQQAGSTDSSSNSNTAKVSAGIG